MLPDSLTEDEIDVPVTNDAGVFNDTLDAWGELHVSFDGESYHVHKHDTRAVGDIIYINSKLGDWQLPLKDVQIEYPHSHKED